jgi:O-antigen/teichoic acid export membrane protein
LGTLIQGFENIGIVAFRKEMQFNKEFKFQVIKKIAGFFVTIPLALTLQSYWALVAGMLTSWCTGVIMSYVLHSYRPRFSLTAGRELFHFSKWLMLNNILFFLKIRFADYVIGKTSGPKQLGLFSVAYEISNLPTTELVAPINRAIFPGYAKIATDMEVLRQGFINVISLIVLVATPIGVGIAVTAEPLIEVFLGSKWLDAIPLVQILAIYGVTVAMQTNLAAVYLALGIPKVLTLLSAAHVALLIPLVIWLTGSDGAIGAAWAYLIISTLFIPINYSVMFRRIQLKPMTLIANFWRSLTSSIIMYAVVYFYLDYTHNPAGGFGNDLFRLISSAGIGAAVYIACVLGLWRASRKPGGAEATALDFVLPKIKAKMGYTQ